MNDVIRWIVGSLILGFVIGHVMIHLHGHQPSRSQDRNGSFRLLATLGPRNLFTDVVQGIIVGCVLAFITFKIIAHAYVTRVDGWTTMFGCSEPGNGIPLRGACASEFPGPINVSQEAVYWTTKVASTGQRLSGRHDYILHFPPAGLPPNNAFWSLTMADARQGFVPNPINRYNVSDRSGLVKNADGSVDIHIQNTAPADQVSNWLPAPSGEFILWLRVYLPRQAILDGTYRVPPVVEAQ